MSNVGRGEKSAGGVAPRGHLPIRSFQDLEVWQVGKQLAVLVYGLTAGFPASEAYGLSSQIRRAAVSVPGNVAEGCGRFHFLDRIKFFLNARGSLQELESHLMIARELRFGDDVAILEATRLVEVLSVKLNNLIAVTRKQVQGAER